jgi:LmbE family N-acetylglucosaminyl deacetylase
VAKDPSVAWRVRHRRWLRYVHRAVKVMEAGNRIPLGPSGKPLVPPASSAAGEPPVKVVVCSPHPDDEALVGALPLRLRLETGAQVTDCAITLGSNVSHRARRLRELESACRALGFELIVPLHPSGFDNVNLKTRTSHPEEWAAKVETLSAIFERLQPEVVFAPHADDFNTTHIGTHFLAVEALGAHLAHSGRGPLLFIETEYWHENAQPNLMVGVSPEVEAILVMATAEHGGEVRRNPYHLRHPSRMIENVRLGAEVVGGQGGPAPDFPLAELYRVTFMKAKEIVAPKPGGCIVGPMEKIDVAWLLEQFRPEGL